MCVRGGMCVCVGVELAYVHYKCSCEAVWVMSDDTGSVLKSDVDVNRSLTLTRHICTRIIPLLDLYVRVYMSCVLNLLSGPEFVCGICACGCPLSGRLPLKSPKLVMYGYVYNANMAGLVQYIGISMICHLLGYIKPASVVHFLCRSRGWYSMVVTGRMWLPMLEATYHCCHGFTVPLVPGVYLLIVCGFYIILPSGRPCVSGHSQLSGGSGVAATGNVYENDASVSYMRLSPTVVINARRDTSAGSSEYVSTVMDLYITVGQLLHSCVQPRWWCGTC